MTAAGLKGVFEATGVTDVLRESINATIQAANVTEPAQGTMQANPYVREGTRDTITASTRDTVRDSMTADGITASTRDTVRDSMTAGGFNVKNMSGINVTYLD